MRITIIGSGNAAYHLATSLFNTGHRIAEVFGRNEETTKELAGVVNARSNTSPEKINGSSDLYLCAVPDDAIIQVVHALQEMINSHAIVAHTSGVHGLDVFPGDFEHAAVFYPLQTFSRDIPVDMSGIPILIDARQKRVIEILTSLAQGISGNPITGITESQKAHLHLAAVFANNFPNHLFRIAAEICAELDLDFKLLRPLMIQTVRKLDFMPPAEAQTGPAIRHDLKTIEKHQALLSDHPVRKEIYTLLTKAIAEK